MAKYTEVFHELLIDEKVSPLIQRAMSSYELYTPVNPRNFSYVPTREELNKKIVDHYRFYEIGSETVGRFLYNLEMTLNEIMPKYNQLFKSVDIMNGIDDIFGNLDVTETFEEEREGTNSSTGSDVVTGSSTNTNNNTVTSQNSTDTEMTTSGRNANSKTPQSQLSAKKLENITAASEMSWNEDSNSSNSTSNDSSTTNGTTTSETEQNTTSNVSGTSAGTTTHTLTRKGNQGVNTYAHDMLEFRQLILNIEMQIINDPELANCFMLVW